MFRALIVTAINLYQRSVKTWLPATCRFAPSCSDYARQAILKYGFWRGGLKAALRISRCHPWSREFGDDPLI